MVWKAEIKLDHLLKKYFFGSFVNLIFYGSRVVVKGNGKVPLCFGTLLSDAKGVGSAEKVLSVLLGFHEFYANTEPYLLL